jgi:hypothetical protein
MKRTIVSILLLAGLVSPAAAKMKSKAKNSGHIPYALNPNIDHSKDVAYSAAWAHKAVSPSPDANFAVTNIEALPTAMPGKTYFYSYGLNGFTLYGRYAQVRMNAPYMGMDAPSWDGPEKNKYRNMRANNESEPLPSNHGK